MTKSPCMQSILFHQEVLEQHYLACMAFLSHLHPSLSPVLFCLFLEEFSEEFQILLLWKALKTQPYVPSPLDTWVHTYQKYWTHQSSGGSDHQQTLGWQVLAPTPTC